MTGGALIAIVPSWFLDTQSHIKYAGVSLTDVIQVAGEQNTNSETSTLDIGRESILAQSAALACIAQVIGPEFEAAVQLIVQSTGRVIVIGMGKSGICLLYTSPSPRD